MKIVLKIVFSIIFLIFLPALLSVFAETKFLTNKLLEHQLVGENFDVESFNDFCLALSIFLNSVILGINHAVVCYKESIKKERVDALLLYCKEILTKTLSEVWGSDGNIGINIRVFVPHNRFLFLISKVSWIEKRLSLYYKIKNIVTWAETGNTDKLKLRVNNTPQGLVGQCYKTKSMIYDNKLRDNNESNYQLNKSQIDQTRELTISICVPILDASDNVIAIVAYDSTENITISDSVIESDKTKIPLITFARRMYEIAPEIFK